MFNIDFELLIFRNLPTFKRWPIRRVWLKVIIKPIRQIYDSFIAFRDEILLELSYSGQVIVLERMLNIKFPNTGSAIYIDNTPNRIPVHYIFDNDESQDPLFIYDNDESPQPPFIYDNDEYESTYDFIVYVPSALVFDEATMRAQIDKYKHAAKRYKINTY